eukprot:sb/3478879/
MGSCIGEPSIFDISLFKLDSICLLTALGIRANALTTVLTSCESQVGRYRVLCQCSDHRPFEFSDTSLAHDIYIRALSSTDPYHIFVLKKCSAAEFTS